MPAFYIVTQDGFLKKYYSGKEATDSQNPVFSDFLRKAMIFKSFSEAKNIIIQENLDNCNVINQYGNIQTE